MENLEASEGSVLKKVYLEIGNRLLRRFDPLRYGTPHEQYNMGYCDALGELAEWVEERLSEIEARSSIEERCSEIEDRSSSDRSSPERDVPSNGRSAL